MTSLNGIAHRHPDILSGATVFVGTRVPIRILFDDLEGGESLDEFLHQFPSVKRDQAIAVLESAFVSIADDAAAAWAANNPLASCSEPLCHIGLHPAHAAAFFVTTASWHSSR